jgi:hypothetical protein
MIEKNKSSYKQEKGFKVLYTTITLARAVASDDDCDTTKLHWLTVRDID